jgi:hypothetical protein
VSSVAVRIERIVIGVSYSEIPFYSDGVFVTGERKIFFEIVAQPSREGSDLILSVGEDFPQRFENEIKPTANLFEFPEGSRQTDLDGVGSQLGCSVCSRGGTWTAL